MKIKKIISICLTATIALLVMPTTGFAKEEKYQSEKLNSLNFLPNTIVSQPFNQTATLDSVVGIEDGKNVMYTTSSAKPAIFNVFDLDSMTLLRSFVMEGTASSWEHIMDKDGNVYVITTDSSRLFRYSPVTKDLKDLGSILGQSAAYQSAFDDEGNLYIGTFPGGYVAKYDVKKGEFSNLGQAHPGNDYVRSLSYQNGYLWAGSNGTGNAVMVKINPKTGEKKSIEVPIRADKYTEVTNIYSQTNLGRYCITYGANGKGNNCWMVFDYQEEKWTDVVVTNGGGGIYASPPMDGKCYFNTAEGIKALNLDTLEVSNTNISNSFTCRKYFVVDFKEGLHEGFGKNTLVAVSGNGQPIFVNLETAKVQTMTQAEMKGGYISLQHVATGPDDILYLGGYMGSRVAMYNTKTGETNYMSMGQTENIKWVGDKMYMGVYAAGTLYEFDPQKPVDNKTNPELLLTIKNDQDRPYIIDGDDRYVVAGSVATYGKLGGAITIYDKQTKTYEIVRNVVEDQSVVGIAIKDGLIYGSTTVSGGLGITPTQTQAKIFVYDIAKKEKINEFIPEWPDEIKNLKDPVKIIGDLEFGPDGLLWGATQGYLFALDPVTLKTVKSKVVGTFNYSGDGHFWMPRHIRFDKDGLLYASIDYGIILDTDTMEYINLESYTKSKSNIMDIDSNGNIYFGLVGTLRKVPVTKNPVSQEEKAQIYQKLGKSIVLTLDKENAIVNGKVTQIDKENKAVRPITIDGRTMLPVRFVAEALNAEVSFIEESNSAQLKLDGKTIDIPIGKKEMIINGVSKEIDVPAEVVNERTLLPIRALCEALDKQVFWDDKGLIVISDENEILDSTKDKALIQKTIDYFTTYAPYDYVQLLEDEKKQEEILKEENDPNKESIKIKNFDFEEGKLSDIIPSWTSISSTLPDGCSYSVSDEVAYRNKQALYIEDSSDKASVGVMSAPVRIEAGSEYTLKTNLYIDSGRTSVLFKFYDENLKEVLSQSANIDQGQGECQTVTIKATPPKGARYARAVLTCSNLWVTKSYYDNVRIYKEK